jgi:DNA polymerase-3 subunit delta'
MRFQDIPGHTELVEKLISNVQNNKVSHAQLLLGKEGSGNLELAIAFAQYILCEKQDKDSCGACPSCLKSAKYIHPDIHFIFPNATSKLVSSKPSSDQLMSEWRSFLLASFFPNQHDWVEYMDFGNKQLTINKLDCQSILKSTSLKSFEGNFKIFIIWLPERLHYTAAPKLLKVIEEPPEKTLFLFVGHNKTDILPTILSRLQMVNVGQFKEGEIYKYLLQSGLNEPQAKQISRVSEGSIHKAVVLQEQDSSSEDFNSFFKWMRLCFSVHKEDNIVKIFEWIDGFARIGRERQKAFFNSAIEILRSCIQINYNRDFNMDGFLQDEQKTLKKFAPFINHANLLEFINQFEEAVSYIERNANPKIVCINMSLKFAKIIRLK